jgi:hypothetical protein
MMNDYMIAKFIHMIGALGFFMARGVEWLSLSHARQARTSDQVRERLRISNSVRRTGPLSMLLILVSGFYMMAIAKISSAWIIVAFGSLIVMVVLGVALSGRRMAAIGRTLAVENGPISSSLRDLLYDPLRWLSIRLQVSIALGIVFLMTVKPDLIGALLTMAVVVILGLAFSLPVRVRDRKKLQAQ